MSQQHELELQAVTITLEAPPAGLVGAHYHETLRTIPSLRRADGGGAAWRMLLAAFVFEALLWGFPLSFGVFQNYYSQLPEFKGDPFIAVVDTTASGISYMAALACDSFHQALCHLPTLYDMDCMATLSPRSGCWLFCENTGNAHSHSGRHVWSGVHYLLLPYH